MSKYEIYIKNETNGGASDTNGYAEPQLPTGKNQQKSGLSSLIAKSGSALSFAQQGVGYALDIVARDSNSSDFKERTNATMSLVAQGLGIVTAFATGGPIAGVAAIGASMFSQYKDIEQHQYNAKWESVEIASGRGRAGPSFNRGRTHDIF